MPCKTGSPAVKSTSCAGQVTNVCCCCCCPGAPDAATTTCDQKGGLFQQSFASQPSPMESLVTKCLGPPTPLPPNRCVSKNKILFMAPHLVSLQKRQDYKKKDIVFCGRDILITVSLKTTSQDLRSMFKMKLPLTYQQCYFLHNDFYGC